MAKVTIDGHLIEVPDGTTILNAARLMAEQNPELSANVPPAMCYYSKLQGSGGKCRTCLVQVTKGSEKDPRPMPKLVASCRTTVMDGMEVQNKLSAQVQDARKGVVEFLLLNHPLDCPVCDQAGECHLQDLGYEHGSQNTRYEFKRRTFDVEDIGDNIKLHMNRCILCYRCVFTANQITDGRVHGVINRGDHAEISTYVHQAIENDFSGNVIDVCPVGALTDKTFRFKSRVWNTNPYNAHRECNNPKCNGHVVLWMAGNDILRVTARKDQWGEVESFICNDCRFDKKSLGDWIIEGPRQIDRHSVISGGHYTSLSSQKVLEKSTTFAVMEGSKKD
jgi:NADH-quinone oxidoreductase subunit G